VAVFIPTARVVQALKYMTFGSADSAVKKSVSCIKTQTQEQRISMYREKCK